jgi:hypothetical protein
VAVFRRDSGAGGHWRLVACGALHSFSEFELRAPETLESLLAARAAEAKQQAELKQREEEERKRREVPAETKLAAAIAAKGTCSRLQCFPACSLVAHWFALICSG